MYEYIYVCIYIYIYICMYVSIHEQWCSECVTSKGTGNEGGGGGGERLHWWIQESPSSLTGFGSMRRVLRKL